MPVGSKLLALLSTSFHLRSFTLLRRTHHYCHPLAAFSSYAASHGRLRSVFFCPKLRFWSGAVNQFHSEAVINEGCGEAATSFPDAKNSHPWPEWSKFVNLLVEKGYSDWCATSDDDDDAFLAEKDLPEEFLKASEACLCFARDRPDILRLLAKKNIESVVLNGSPFLFKNGENSARRMKLFLTGEGSSELELEKAQTIDIMRYLLSYAYGSLSSSGGNNLKSDELVERSARKLLGEFFNLSGTVWKPKSVDATLTELPLSNEQLMLPGQYTEMRSVDSIYPNIPGRSSVASENQPSASSNFTDTEYGKSMVNQKEGPEASASSQTGAQPSTSVFEKVVDPWSRAQKSSTSNKQILNETNAACGYNTYGGYTGKPTEPSGNLWTGSNTSYGASTTNSSHPPGNSWIDHHSSYGGYNVNSTQPSSNSSMLYGRPTANPSLPPSNSWDNNNTSYARDSVNSTHPFNSSSNSNSSYGGSTVNSSQPPSGSWSNYNSSYGVCTANSTPTSSNSWANSNRPYGGSTPNSSQPPSDSWSNYNSSYGVCTANSTQPSSNSWANNNRSCGGSTPNSSQLPSDYRSNYNTGYGKYIAESNETSSNSWIDSNKSHSGFTANSSQPPSNSWNNYNTSHGGFIGKSTPASSNSSTSRNTLYSASENSSESPSDYRSNYNTGYGRYIAESNKTYSNSWIDSNKSHSGITANSSQQPGGFTGKSTPASSNSSTSGNTSYSASENSSQPPRDSWNNYGTPYHGCTMKSAQPSTQPSSNSWSNNNGSFGGPSTNSSQPPGNLWNSYDTNTKSSIEPSRSSWKNSNSYVESSAGSYLRYTANPTQPSSYSWNNNSTYPAAPANPPQSSSSAWNNSRESCSGGFPQANSELPSQGQTQNVRENGNYGYTGKSLEGSCVKEPDPLDMSEEAKAERWFRRAAQIKDISELSQIPDEDFPQIMPMRKGVNRFVVSKRKTPLERRLASQQYKRNIPVVSSEPEKEPTDGDSKT